AARFLHQLGACPRQRPRLRGEPRVHRDGYRLPHCWRRCALDRYPPDVVTLDKVRHWQSGSGVRHWLAWSSQPSSSIRCKFGELSEILDEMRPVEVSTVGRQVGPLNRPDEWILGLPGPTYGLLTGAVARVRRGHSDFRLNPRVSVTNPSAN